MEKNSYDMCKIGKHSFVVFMFFFIISACVKNTGSIQYVNDNSGAITLSKPVVKRTEPLLVTVKNPGNNITVRWAINPSANTSFTAVNGQDTAILAFFQFPGMYRITASYFTLADTIRAYDSSSSIVTVNDSIYVAPPPGLGPDTVLLEGDQLIFTPGALPNSGFELYGGTSRLYKCSSVVEAFGESVGIASYTFNFSNAEVIYNHQDTCRGELRPAYVVLTLGPMSNGIYSLNMVFNRESYQGSVNVTDSNFTITWNYSSGIIISPLQIKR